MANSKLGKIMSRREKSVGRDALATMSHFLPKYLRKPASVIF
jgi:hypothetical protein